MENVSAEMPKYKCHKEVWALKIAKVEGCVITPVDTRYAPITAPSEMYLRYTPTAGDYYVVYQGGYKSFSPAKEFEDGYTAIGSAHPAVVGMRALDNDGRVKPIDLGSIGGDGVGNGTHDPL